jgi:hypothetical protein
MLSKKTPEQLAELKALKEQLEGKDGNRWCGKCYHFHVDEEKPSEGECREGPPTPVALPVVEFGKQPRFQAIACVPSTARHETCGRFLDREDGEKKFGKYEGPKALEPANG